MTESSKKKTEIIKPMYNAKCKRRDFPFVSYFCIALFIMHSEIFIKFMQMNNQ